jgi:hypothetical protein
MDRQVDSAAMAATFAAASSAELRARYDAWAETYDAENAAAGFRLPYLCAAFLARHLPATDQNPGRRLRHWPWRRLPRGAWLPQPVRPRPVRADARARRGARRLPVPALHDARRMPESDLRGLRGRDRERVFTEGHAPSTSFEELIRVTRPGGCLVFSVRNDLYEDRGFREDQDSLEAQGRWRLRESSAPCRSFVIKEPHILARIFVYEAL